MSNQETVGDWLNRTHQERYEKNKSYRIINPAGYRVLSESSADLYPQWWVNDVLHNRVVEIVEETETQFIVTAGRPGRKEWNYQS